MGSGILSYVFSVFLGSELAVFLSYEFVRRTITNCDAATAGVLSPSPCLGGVSLGLMLAFTGGDCNEIHIL